MIRTTAITFSISLLVHAVTFSQTMKVHTNNGITEFAISEIDSITFSLSGITEGLVAYYPFNGNANDESGNGLNGTVNSATLATDRFGNSNSAYLFGGNSFIDLSANTQLNPTDGITLTAWLSHNGSGGQYQAIVNRWGTVSNIGQDAYIFEMETRKVRFIISRNGAGDASGTTTIQDPNTVPLNTWIFYAATWDGNTMRLFRNGVEVASGSENTMFLTTVTKTGIGASLGRAGDRVASFFNGKIDEIRIYNRALSHDEIQILFNN